MSLERFPYPEIVPVPVGCIATRRAFDILFDRMYPGDLAREPTRETRHTFREHTEVVSDRMRAALFHGDLVALAIVNGEKFVIPSHYWHADRPVNMRSGRLFIAAEDLAAWQDLNGKACFFDQAAFLAWLDPPMAMAALPGVTNPSPAKRQVFSLAKADEPHIDAILALLRDDPSLSPNRATERYVGDGTHIVGDNTDLKSKVARVYKRVLSALKRSQNFRNQIK